MRRSIVALLAFTIVPASLSAQEPATPEADPHYQTVRHSWYFGGFGGRSQLILGSADPRAQGGLSIAYGRPDHRLRYGRTPAQLVLEAYYARSHSPGAEGQPRNDSNNLGILGYARYRWPMRMNLGWYFDVGWGLQLSDRTTVDLDSRISSAPMIGFGGAFRTGSQETLLGLRLLHISNAGTRGGNNGQNQLLVTLSVRY